MYGIWNRLQYMLSPQFDIYETISSVVYGRVADVGSGTGFGTHLLARHASSVTGYEIDQTAKSFADRAFSNGNIRFVEADITDFPDQYINKYDFVTMVDVIEHIRYDGLAVGGCKKILKSGGKLYCSTPNRLSRYRKSDHHVREYSPQELLELLTRAFRRVDLVDYQLEPIKSDYENPILAICSKE